MRWYTLVYFGEPASHVIVLGPQQLTAAVDESHLCSQSAEEVGHFRGDVAASQDRQPAGLFRQPQCFVRSDVWNILQAWNVRHHGPGSGGDQHGFCGDFLSIHLKGFSAGEPPPGFEHCDVVCFPVAFFDGPGISVHFVNGAGNGGLPIYSLNCCLDAENVGAFDGVHHVGTVDKHLGRDAAPVQAGSAERAFFDDGHRQPETRRLGGDFKAGTGAYYHQVEVLHIVFSERGKSPQPPFTKGGRSKDSSSSSRPTLHYCSTALQHRYAPLGLGQAWRNTYRGGKRERLFSSLVMNSINAGCPVSITCLARLMAGIISAGSTTLSPWAPNDWARVA